LDFGSVGGRVGVTFLRLIEESTGDANQFRISDESQCCGHPGLERVFDGRYAPDAVIAADLARSTSTRERSAGLTALEEMRQRWLAKHTR
jgi:hypothetical protein